MARRKTVTHKSPSNAQRMVWAASAHRIKSVLARFKRRGLLERPAGWSSGSGPDASDEQPDDAALE